MKREDIDFLRELQHELNTQTNDGNADPVFWGIEEDKTDAYLFCAGEIYTFSEAVEMVHERVVDSGDDDLMESWNETDRDSIEEVADFYQRHFGFECTVEWLDKERRISEQTGCFLTKRAAQKHLESNKHHYVNGKTYAMTAWRNPEFERLIGILKKMNMDDIKTDA